MKKLLKILLVLLGIVVIVIAGGLIYVKSFLPNVGPPPDIQVELTKEYIERGDYLSNHVMVCIDCHSLRDWELFSGPPIPGTFGAGGEYFGREFGFPGVFISPNITPYGVGEWSDGELFRAITTGVTRDNQAIFPVMPYLDYGKLDEEDIRAVIAFVRTLPSIEASHPEREVDFPLNFILNTIPKKASLTTRPDPSFMVDYGKYMFTAAACTECHTKAVGGKVVGEYLAGGYEFNFPDGSVLRSTNITPHETGIGFWNREFFINRFRLYTDTLYDNPAVGPGEFQTVMPWVMYGGMTEKDLGAIYDYLKTVPPVDNFVERFTFAEN
jgi:hypothetical protein